jgi:PadR family transcriptional regulator PadR
MKMTLTTQRVLHALLDSPTDEHYGLEIMRATGLKSGSLYPILGRLEDAGWIEGRWEVIDEAAEGRPRRRLYRLTPDGVVGARATLVETAHQLGFDLART